MKNFSIFQFAKRYPNLDQVPELGKLINISRRDFEEHESFLCTTTSASVEYCCLMIENALLLRTNRAGRVYAGFERLSSFEPIMDRYLRIADISEVVYLFGEDDWQPPRHPNIRVVTLGDDVRLSHETFLITQSSTLNSAFVAVNEVPEGPFSPDLLRYRALKTSNKTIVATLTNAIEGIIDWSLAA